MAFESQVWKFIWLLEHSFLNVNIVSLSTFKNWPFSALMAFLAFEGMPDLRFESCIMFLYIVWPWWLFFGWLREMIWWWIAPLIDLRSCAAGKKGSKTREYAITAKARRQFLWPPQHNMYDMALLALLDDIAWLMNISWRGGCLMSKDFLGWIRLSGKHKKI